MKKQCIIWLMGCLGVAHAQVQPVSYLDQTFSLPANVITGNTMDVITGDLDGDGHVDVVLAREFEKNWILWNDGTGQFATDPSRSFAQVKFYPQGFTGEDSEDIALFDAEIDGDLDLLFVTEDTDLHEFFLNDGQGNFTLAPFQFPKPSNSNAVLVVDVNQDSFPDILIGQNGPNALYINQQNGSFQADTAALLPTNLDWTQDLKQADLDGDGDLDLVEGCDLGQTHLYFYDNGAYVSGDANLPTDLDSIETRKVVLGDVDVDGDIDIFLCNVGWNPAKKAQDALLINDGQGHFTEETTTRFPYFHSITLDGVFHDFTGDSLPDLLMVGGNEVTNYNLYQNDPSNPGHFLPDNQTLPFFAMSTTIAMTLADLNNDSLPDLYFGVFQGSDRLFFTEKAVVSAINLSEVGVRAFPNPAQHTLIIRSDRRTVGTIYALTGQRIRGDIPIEGDTEIDIRALPAGMYVLELDGLTRIRFEKR